MKTKIDCIPCMIRQTVEAARLATDNELLQRKILQSILHSIDNPDFNKSPPELAQKIHKRIRELTGVTDPYKIVKDRFNSSAGSF